MYLHIAELVRNVTECPTWNELAWPQKNLRNTCLTKKHLSSLITDCEGQLAPFSARTEDGRKEKCRSDNNDKVSKGNKKKKNKDCEGS